MEAQKLDLRKLNPQQEVKLVKYIEDLTGRLLQPTREMVRNFACSIAKQNLSMSWVTRFLNQNKINLATHWTTGMDRDRTQLIQKFNINCSLNFCFTQLRNTRYNPVTHTIWMRKAVSGF
jgi:hypothetical protein